MTKTTIVILLLLFLLSSCKHIDTILHNALVRINKQSTQQFSLKSSLLDKAEIRSGLMASARVEVEEFPGQIVQLQMSDPATQLITTTSYSNARQRLPDITLTGPLELNIYDSPDLGLKFSGKLVDAGQSVRKVFLKERVSITIKGAQKIELAKPVELAEPLTFHNKWNNNLEQFHSKISTLTVKPVQLDVYNPLQLTSAEKLKVTKLGPHQLTLQNNNLTDTENRFFIALEPTSQRMEQIKNVLSTFQNIPQFTVKRILSGEAKPYMLYRIPVILAAIEENETEEYSEHSSLFIISILEDERGIISTSLQKSLSRDSVSFNGKSLLPGSQSEPATNLLEDISFSTDKLIDVNYGNVTDWQLQPERAFKLYKHPTKQLEI